MTEATSTRTGLLEAAAGGDDRALQQLLQALADEGPGAWGLLLDATNKRLWERLLRAAARASLTSGAAMAEPPPPADDRLLGAAAVAFTGGRDRAAEPVRRQVLLDGLDSTESSIRAEAAELLGRRGDEDALPHLERLTEDRNDHVRAAAVRAVSQLAPASATPILVRALERYDVAAAEAVAGLIRIGAAAVPPLLEDLRRGSPWTRWHAAKALGGIRDPRSIGPLVDALTDEDASVRWEAVHALSTMGADVLAPLCDKLCSANVTPWLAEGADRVLRRAAGGELRRLAEPLHQALHHLDAAVEAPVQADRLRRQLRTRG